MIPLSDFVLQLRAVLDRQIADGTDRIATHRAPDFETYSVEFGKLSGLQQARTLLDDLVKRINSGDI